MKQSRPIYYVFIYNQRYNILHRHNSNYLPTFITMSIDMTKQKISMVIWAETLHKIQKLSIILRPKIPKLNAEVNTVVYKIIQIVPWYAGKNKDYAYFDE